MEGLTPHEIKVLLYNEQITIAQLSRDIPCSRQWVYATINRIGTNPGQTNVTNSGITTYVIRRHIAKKLDVDYETMWGEPDPHQWYGQFLVSRKKVNPTLSERHIFNQYIEAQRKKVGKSKVKKWTDQEYQKARKKYLRMKRKRLKLFRKFMMRRERGRK